MSWQMHACQNSRLIAKLCSLLAPPSKFVEALELVGNKHGQPVQEVMQLLANARLGELWC